MLCVLIFHAGICIWDDAFNWWINPVPCESVYLPFIILSHVAKLEWLICMVSYLSSLISLPGYLMPIWTQNLPFLVHIQDVTKITIIINILDYCILVLHMHECAFLCVCVCVCACAHMRACMHACVRGCVVCVCEFLVSGTLHLFVWLLHMPWLNWEGVLKDHRRSAQRPSKECSKTIIVIIIIFIIIIIIFCCTFYSLTVIKILLLQCQQQPKFLWPQLQELTAWFADKPGESKQHAGDLSPLHHGCPRQIFPSTTSHSSVSAAGQASQRRIWSSGWSGLWPFRLVCSSHSQF